MMIRGPFPDPLHPEPEVFKGVTIEEVALLRAAVNIAADAPWNLRRCRVRVHRDLVAELRTALDGCGIRWHDVKTWRDSY